MDSSELSFLRLAYKHIPESTKLEIQKMYNNIIPESYRLNLCSLCSKQVAEEDCSICNKSICEDCSIVCPKSEQAVCLNDYSSCGLCRNCACDYCRVYINNNLCDACLEENEKPFVCYTCANKNRKRKRCAHCEQNMNDITQQSKVSKKEDDRTKKDDTVLDDLLQFLTKKIGDTRTIGSYTVELLTFGGSTHMVWTHGARFISIWYGFNRVPIPLDHITDDCIRSIQQYEELQEKIINTDDDDKREELIQASVILYVQISKMLFVSHTDQ